MTDDRQERISQRAHEIWEREGRPHGRDEEHWREAAAALEAEEKAAAKPARKPRAAKPKAPDHAEPTPAPAPRKKRGTKEA